MSNRKVYKYVFINELIYKLLFIGFQHSNSLQLGQEGYSIRMSICLYMELPISNYILQISFHKLVD